MEREIWKAIWLLFLLLCSLLFIIIRKIESRRCNNKVPPGPPKLPIIGNLHQLGGLLHRSLHQLSMKYGPVMYLQLGSVPTVIVSSAQTAREVLKTYDLECCGRPLLASTGGLSYNYLDVAFTPYGSYWREMRKICVLELFSVKRVQSFRFTREEEVALMIDSISKSSSSGKPVYLSKKLMSLTSEITCRVAFGSSTFRDGEFDVEKFQELVHEALGIIGSFSASDFFPYVGWIIDRITGYYGRLERIFHDFDLFYQQLIDDHLRSGRQKQENEDIIDVLLKIMENQIDSSALQITHDHIKAILMNIFLAGVDTSAAVVGWSMAELMRNPRVMTKAQEEIRNCKGKKGKVSEIDIDQLQYLKLVVKEALRLHPPGSLINPRESMSHININGRRGCPGMNMGMMIVELAMANLLYHFDWKLPNGLKEEDLNMEEAAGQTTYKKEDLLLVPTKYVCCN
ncbi:hypothetical protein PTKIN_Ptkin14bG0129500 [Pterospermum kingtungense]